MTRPFDPTLKTLAELSPADWLPLAGRRRRRVTIEDSDIGTIVSGATDKLFRVHDRPEDLLHLDFEAGHFRADLPLRLRLYNSVSLSIATIRAVVKAVTLLCPEADSPHWTGFLQCGLPDEAPLSTLRYEVIRIWQIPAEQLLCGGVGTLALAPVSDVPEGEVRQVIRRMKERLSGPHAPRERRTFGQRRMCFWAYAIRMRYARALFEEVLGMEQSATYRAIVRKGREEGRAEEARRLLFLLGEKQFGPPDATTRAVIERIADVAQLEELAVELMNAGSWQELLPPQTRRRSGRCRTRP